MLTSGNKILLWLFLHHFPKLFESSSHLLPVLNNDGQPDKLAAEQRHRVNVGNEATASCCVQMET